MVGNAAVTEFDTTTLDGMPASKLVGSTYHGTPLETSYVYVVCAYEFTWLVNYCAVSAQTVAAMGYYVLSRRQLPRSCSPNTASGLPCTLVPLCNH